MSDGCNDLPEDLWADDPELTAEEERDTSDGGFDFGVEPEDEDCYYGSEQDEGGSYLEDEEFVMTVTPDVLEMAKQAITSDVAIQARAYRQAHADFEREQMAKLDECGLRYLKDEDAKTIEAYQRLKANDRAKQLFQAEQRGNNPLPEFMSLADALNEPEEDEPYIVADLIPAGAVGLLVAQAKAGKTSLLDNLLRSLVDRDPFLGCFEVRTQPRTVVLIDTEMSRRLRLRWLRDQGIKATDRIHIVTIRGCAGSFDVTDPNVRTQWAEKLREIRADYVVWDNVRPVLDALSLDENHDLGTLLSGFKSLLAEAGVEDGLAVHHAGWSGNRMRGDSSLLGYVDYQMLLTRQGDSLDGPRYFSAYGRDVSVDERSLRYSAVNRHLALDESGLSRRDTERADRVREALLYISRNPGKPKSTVKASLHMTEKEKDPLLRELEKEGLISVEVGPRNARLCNLTDGGRDWLMADEKKKVVSA